MSTPLAAGEAEASCDAGAEAGGALAAADGAALPPGLEQAVRMMANAANDASVLRRLFFVINVVSKLAGGLG
jgi:hypothetical protein